MGQTGQIKCSSENNSLVDQQYATSTLISIYRVSLVKDESMAFDQVKIYHSEQAQFILQNFIKSKGQTDREQFCVALLNTRNETIGLNMVSTGDLATTCVHPREVLKSAILANAAGIILGHNHPSNDPSPSHNDVTITKRIIKACEIMGIRVHDHLIVNMDDDGYYSFADEGLIERYSGEVGRI